jgi:phage terminase large subunit-like protein
MLEAFSELPAHQRAERYYTAVSAESCRRSLRKFVRSAWPLIDPKDFVGNWHIDALCDHLAYVALGEIRNLMVNVPPRATKSSIVSVAFPAWVWTNEPEVQFLTASYVEDLAVGDAIKMRRLIESEWYRSRYPDLVLLGDENRAERFGNIHGGYRQTIAVGTKTTGMGGDIKLLDDPHNATDVEKDSKRKQAVNWHDNAWRSRNNDPNTVRHIYVGQRTHDGDIFGHVLAREEKRWVVLCLPMEFEADRKCITFKNRGKGPEGPAIFEDPRKFPGELLDPKRYSEDTIEELKESTPKRTWDAQYQQRPEGAGGRILKRHWWRKWGWPEWHPEFGKSKRPLPEAFAVIQSYDTAFEQGEEDSYTVRTTWALFYHQEDVAPGERRKHQEERISSMILERKKWRPGFGEMRDEAVEAAEQWDPDRVLIEKKASGHALVKELRQKGLPVRAIKIQGDLVYRAHMASLPLEKGAVWYVDRPWAKDFIDTCAKFPGVDFDDEIASLVIALMYMRIYMDLELEDDDKNEELALFDPKIVRRHGFYG